MHLYISTTNITSVHYPSTIRTLISQEDLQSTEEALKYCTFFRLVELHIISSITKVHVYFFSGGVSYQRLSSVRRLCLPRIFSVKMKSNKPVQHCKHNSDRLRRLRKCVTQYKERSKQSENIRRCKKTRECKHTSGLHNTVSPNRQPFKDISNLIDVEDMEVDPVEQYNISNVSPPAVELSTEGPMECEEMNIESSQRPNITLNFYFGK